MSNRPGICSVCSRPDAGDIDHALAVSGASWRSVARKYGLGRSAVNRHAHDHLGARLKRAAEARAAGSDPALLDKLMELNRITRGILGEALRAGDRTNALSAVARAEKQLELEARLIGQLRDGGTTVNVKLDAAAAERMAEVFLARRRGALPPASAAIEASLAESEPESGASAPADPQEPE